MPASVSGRRVLPNVEGGKNDQPAAPTRKLLGMAHRQALGVIGAIQFYFCKAVPLVPHEPHSANSPLFTTQTRVASDSTTSTSCVL